MWQELRQESIVVAASFPNHRRSSDVDALLTTAHDPIQEALEVSGVVEEEGSGTGTIVSKKELR